MYESPTNPVGRRKRLPAGNSWMRRHCHGHAVSLAIWLGGRCQASVYEAPGVLKVRERIACDTEEDAKAIAEELLADAYPHDCEAERCSSWSQFGRARRQLSSVHRTPTRTLTRPRTRTSSRRESPAN